MDRANCVPALPVVDVEAGEEQLDLLLLLPAPVAPPVAVVVVVVVVAVVVVVVVVAAAAAAAGQPPLDRQALLQKPHASERHYY